MISQLKLWFVGLFILAAVAAGVAHTSETLSSDNSEDTVVMSHTVEIKDFVFSSVSVAVKPGDTITWTNLDIVPHTATALNKSWDSGTLKLGESFTLTITEDMQLDYFCIFHPMMKASLKLVKQG